MGNGHGRVGGVGRGYALSLLAGAAFATRRAAHLAVAARLRLRARAMEERAARWEATAGP